MRRIGLILLFLLCTQSIYASDLASRINSKACDAVAKACLAAGFSRDENQDKKFWMDCMKPVILGKKVKGIHLNSVIIKSCRQDKIKALQHELHEFEKASLKQS